MLAKKAKEVLKTLQEEGLLQNFILIGSWCAHFYIPYFGKEQFRPIIETLDIDFLIPQPHRLEKTGRSANEILKALDFESEHTASGWFRYVHPQLRVEFLVPRVGATPSTPRNITQLGITAMPLRHTFILTNHTIITTDSEITVKVPHPLAFAFHKLFVSDRREEPGKAARDKQMAFRILTAAFKTRKTDDLTKIWESFTKKEKTTILQVLRKEKQNDIINLLDKT